MSESNEKPVEQKEAAPAATVEVTPPAPAQPKLAPGLFQGFTLGSNLEQGPTGNKISNLKKPAMDYEKTYKESTRNQSMSPEQLKAIQSAPKEPSRNESLTPEQMQALSEQKK